ncbi:MAG TPA: prolyl oligopeptidase family serine peptidase [Steroidobacteraceae bacterium]|nr:prolyl oligopeptidase family serine peptidase [Steroidobacteraceae bacterium]
MSANRIATIVRAPRALAAAMLCAALLCAGNAQAVSPSPEPPAPALLRDGLTAPAAPFSASLQPYLQWRAAHLVDWLADGSLLITTRFGDTTQVHRVAAPLGERTQLSFAPGGVLEAAARPLDADSLVYIGQEPSGRTRLYLQRLQEHSLQALTEGQYQESNLSWSPDGAQLAFVSNRRSPNAMDVYLLDMRQTGATPRLIAAAMPDMRWRIDGWSADDRHLLLSLSAAAAAPTAEAALQIADVATGQLSPVTLPADSTARRSQARRRHDVSSQGAALQAVSARFAPDGHGLLLLTHALGGSGSQRFLHLVQVDPISGRVQVLSAAASEDVEQFAASPDGRYIAYTLDDQSGASHLRLIDQQRRLETPIVAVPAGVIGPLSFDAASRRLALTVESTHAPADVYVLEPASGALTRWTESETGPADVHSFVQPSVLTFPTWDRPAGQARELPALVYEPAPGSASSAGPRPVVIWLCSGEGNECRPRYAPLIQYLVHELGYVVIAPDVRGSSGLGAELAAAGAGPLRGDAVRDVGSLLVWISLQPGLDRQRVALLGEGFGAYLALQSLAQYADRLQGAVAAFPPPLQDLANVPSIRSPVLLVQGVGEAAAPAYEAARLREGLRAQGVRVQYLAAREAGQFERRSGRMAYHSAAASFLAHLLG